MVNIIVRDNDMIEEMRHLIPDNLRVNCQFHVYAGYSVFRYASQFVEGNGLRHVAILFEPTSASDSVANLSDLAKYTDGHHFISTMYEVRCNSIPLLRFIQQYATVAKPSIPMPEDGWV